MTDRKIHGVIGRNDVPGADYLFRISLKGFVQDAQGRVLVAKETGRDWWDLPGGGMDHEESIKDALRRELNEEVTLEGDFSYKIIAVEEPGKLARADVWQIRLIFKVVPKNLGFARGVDGDAVCFIDAETFKNSEYRRERQVYEYAQLARAKKL